MLTELHDTPVSADRVRAMLQEIVRQAVAPMIARQESDTPASDPEVHLRQIGAEGAQSREAQRARDWSVASTFAGEIARQNGMEPGDIAAPAVARQILALIRQLNDLSLRVEKDLDDPLHAGRDLLLNHGIAPTRDALKPPPRLAEAIEKACAEAPPDVATKIRVIGETCARFFR